MLKTLLTWWNGATLGTLLTIRSRAVPVGEDEQGNTYYEEKKPSTFDGRKRRWVIYNGTVEASRVSPDWHAWLHFLVPEPPTTAPLRRQPWEIDHVPNMTGTPLAYRPKGSLWRGGKRPEATGDYEPWRPE